MPLYRGPYGLWNPERADTIAEGEDAVKCRNRRALCLGMISLPERV